jgi:hypothetical protein
MHGFQQVQQESVYTPKEGILLSKLYDLINPITRSWDEELIRENLWSVDANSILDIPISPTGMQDFLAWHLAKTGLFTVQSVYHV